MAHNWSTIQVQGGPGCSGMIGFFEEHGPFYIDSVKLICRADEKIFFIYH